jgi:hypothetical protein
MRKKHGKRNPQKALPNPSPPDSAVQPPAQPATSFLQPKPSQKSQVDKLWRRVTILDVLALVNVIYVHAFRLTPLIITPYQSAVYRYYELLSGALMLAAGGSAFATAAARNSPATRRRLLRVRTIISSALIALSVIIALGFAEPSRRLALLLIRHIPPLQELGPTVIEKVIDWIIGGIVFFDGSAPTKTPKLWSLHIWSLNALFHAKNLP